MQFLSGRYFQHDFGNHHILLPKVLKQKSSKIIAPMNITSFLSKVPRTPSVETFARVTRTINGYFPGRVYFQGIDWPAKLQPINLLDKFLLGSMVTVFIRIGLTLLVLVTQNQYLRTENRVPT